MDSQQVRRRAFLKQAATVALPLLVPSGVLAAPGRPGANDRMAIGLIGSGYRARDLTKESPADLRLVAVADCDRRQISEYLAAVGKFDSPIVDAKCAQYQDYRQMLAQEKLDGVFIATTPCALAALRSMLS